MLLQCENVQRVQGCAEMCAAHNEYAVNWQTIILHVNPTCDVLNPDGINVKGCMHLTQVISIACDKRVLSEHDMQETRWSEGRYQVTERSL